MFKYILAVILTVMVQISALDLQAQPPKDSTTLRLGMELLHAINSGDRSAQLNFISKNLDAGALQQKPASDRLKAHWTKRVSLPPTKSRYAITLKAFILETNVAPFEI